MGYNLGDPPFKTDPKTGKILGAKYVPDSDIEKNENAVEGDPEKAKAFLRDIGWSRGADMIEIAQAGGNPLSDIVNIQGASSLVEPGEKGATTGIADGPTNAEAAAGAGAYYGEATPDDGYSFDPRIEAVGTNVLHEYASTNYIVTFGCLTPEELNKPDTTYRARPGPRPEHIILSSSGRKTYRRIPTLAETTFKVHPNYYIDELEIETVIAPNPKSRQTNFFNFNFTITEPYSMGQLLQSMSVVAKHAGYENYLKSPWLIMIEFVGFDDEGNTITTGVKKLLPIQLLKVEFGTSVEGSKYVFQATAYNDIAFMDSIQSLKKDFTISGRTVKEALQTGLNSLASHLNTAELRKKAKSESKAEVDEYIFVMPTASASSVLEALLSAPKNLGKATSGDLSLKEFTDEKINEYFETGSEGYEQDNSDFGARIIEQKRAFVEDRLGFSVKRGNLSENIKSVLANANVPANVVGEAKLSPIEALDAGNIPFGLQEFAYNKESGLLERGRTVIDPKQRTITFKAGTKIQRLIEEIVMLSDYGQAILNADRTDDKGRSPWFRIESSVYIVDDKKSEIVYGRKPRIYMYRIVPYMVHRSKFQMPNDPPPGFDKLKSQAARQFDYMYTGRNNDILNFDITLDNAFYEALAIDVGNDRSQGSKGSGTVKKEAQVVMTGTGEERPAITASEMKEVNEDLADTAGAFDETTAIQVARQFNEAIVNSSTNLLSVDLEVMGDPYFITDSGVGNYNSDGTNFININVDNSISYQLSEVDIIINFRTPIDIGEGEGYQFDGPTMGLESFSGLYQVLSVTNIFSGNVFTQQMRCIRRKNYELSKYKEDKDGKAAEIEAKRKKALAQDGLTEEEIAFIKADRNMDGKLSVVEAASQNLSVTEAQNLAQGKKGKNTVPSDQARDGGNPGGAQTTGTSTTTNQQQADEAQGTSSSSTSSNTQKTVPARTGGDGSANIDRYYRYGNNNR